MISLYFGLPGCGKTTLLCSIACKYIKKGVKVYGNVHLALPGYTYIDNDCIGKYMLEDCIILIDEGAVFANSRDYKNFSLALTNFFNLHRHYNADIMVFSQRYNGIDKNIRTLCERVYYVYKSGILSHWVTKYYPIPYGMIIPDTKKGESSKLGEIIEGYCKPGFFTRLFRGGKVWRKKYYKYFDSWERPVLPPLPEQYISWQEQP